MISERRLEASARPTCTGINPALSTRKDHGSSSTTTRRRAWSSTPKPKNSGRMRIARVLEVLVLLSDTSGDRNARARPTVVEGRRYIWLLMTVLRRKPTYGAATRLARIVLELVNRPFGWSFEGICRELDVSERTLLRYIEASERELVDWNGRPMLEVAKHGSNRKLRLADLSRSPDSTAYEAASLYFVLTFLKFLEGTIIEEGVEGLWERTFKGLSEKQRSRLTDFDRKFFALAFAPKDYSKHDDHLDLIGPLDAFHSLRLSQP